LTKIHSLEERDIIHQIIHGSSRDIGTISSFIHYPCELKDGWCITMKKNEFTFVPVFNPVSDQYINNDKPLQNVLEIILEQISNQSTKREDDV
jgi:hypothetical protein